MADRQVQVAGGAGLVFVALLLVAAFLPAHPPSTEPFPDEVRAFWADQRGAILTAALLTTLATVAWVVFTAALDPREARLAAVIYAALSVGAALVASVPVVAEGLIPEFGDDLTLVLWDGQLLALAASAVPLAVTAVATGLGGTATRTVRWLSLVFGGAGAVTAAVGVLDPGSGAGARAILLLALWVLVAAAHMAFWDRRAGTSALSGTSQDVEL